MHAATAGEIWDQAVQRHGVDVVVMLEINVEVTGIVVVTEGESILQVLFGRKTYPKLK